MLRTVTFVTPSISSNSLGRTHCLWLLARGAGLATRVLAVGGGDIWTPLKGSDFASDCATISPTDLRSHLNYSQNSVTVAIKPLPETFGHLVAESRVSPFRLALDIDDPDLAQIFSWRRPVHRALRPFVRHNEWSSYKQIQSGLAYYPHSVSNPYLAHLYGGTVIPHVRPLITKTSPPPSDTITVAFVGTARAHKGINILREAVSALAPVGFRLVVTDERPVDAKPWESWVGTTSLEEGRTLLMECDIAAIPSFNRVFSRGQLPAKIMDAMMAGRPVVASDVDPLPWAIGDAGLIFRAGSSKDLTRKLAGLADPSTRARLGDRGRARAQKDFSVESNVEPYLAMLESTSVSE